MYANGYFFKEKEGDRKLLINEVQQHEIDVAYYRSIKKGKDVTLEDGTVISNHKLTAPPETPKVSSPIFLSYTKRTGSPSILSLILDNNLSI